MSKRFKVNDLVVAADILWNPASGGWARPHGWGAERRPYWTEPHDIRPQGVGLVIEAERLCPDEDNGYRRPRMHYTVHWPSMGLIHDIWSGEIEHYRGDE